MSPRNFLASLLLLCACERLPTPVPVPVPPDLDGVWRDSTTFTTRFIVDVTHIEPGCTSRAVRNMTFEPDSTLIVMTLEVLYCSPSNWMMFLGSLKAVWDSRSQRLTIGITNNEGGGYFHEGLLQDGILLTGRTYLKSDSLSQEYTVSSKWVAYKQVPAEKPKAALSLAPDWQAAAKQMNLVISDPTKIQCSDWNQGLLCKPVP